ncbi:cell division protein FtsA [Halarcobacter ebronensis]|uniref:Cell division protein FtsA n=1 Tax=Halarcobacter ebronensis TaxID=1462615 RepID=A0A4Q0YHD4_9BACT|nr:cell division protein FtsA [Halarcobacter ebronensis]QKF82260.1 cell division protein FtsA [Halarcobacter ebronensis]RXJ70032.1 cell division protein FtsA [Halarcobacter ebronensis]RXK07707.1 cell division protein FtsA [Halarcobacter ebronensis]
MNKTLLAIDIGSSNITAVIARNNLDYKINILGTGSYKSAGINKGVISNIELASKCIKEAVSIARKNTTEQIESTVVSISGAYTKGIRSSGSVNIPNGVITENEINQVLQMALYNATIIPEYDVIHVIPIFFKIDDSADVENPLSMNGSRLEVSVYVVTAKKTALTNIKSAFKMANLNVNNFVLDGYATAISTLDEQQKKFGATVINIGATTTEVACYKGYALIYNGFIPVGSNHITNDISVMLHTPPIAAEKIKTEYGDLLKTDEELANKKVRTPRIGDEKNSSEVSLEHIQTIIHARVEEILILVKNSLKKSGINESLGTGIVITGGMSKLVGIKELATLVFDDLPVKISNPINIKNGYMSFDDPKMATIVGLLLYSLETNRNFELDSNKNLIRKRKIVDNSQVKEQPENFSTGLNAAADIQKTAMEVNSKKLTEEDDSKLLPTLTKKDKNTGVKKLWNAITEWF